MSLLFFTCDESFEPVYEVPADLQPYVDRFIQEAALRGYAYQIDNLIIRYNTDENVGICGRCNSNATQGEFQKIIYINSDCFYTHDSQIEALIFHELGHCFLSRSHDTALLPNGDSKSIMVSNNISLYSPCLYPVDDDNSCNFTYKREYYLDELFDANTPVPNWAE